MEQDKITDDLLKKVLPKVCDELVDEWENSPIEKHKFSDNFNQQMETLIKKHKKKNLFSELNVIVKIAASILIIVGICFFSNTIAARAGWDIMFKKIEVALEDASMYVYDNETDTYSFTQFEPGYIPKGYEEVSRIVNANKVYLNYVNSEGKTITWNQLRVTDGMLMGSDAEYDEIIEKEYAGENVKIYVYDSGSNRLYYEMGNCIFNMTATDISADDMYRMIEEMREIE